jgi:hypothetical protein
MTTLAGQMVNAAQPNPQWVACDGKPYFVLDPKQPQRGLAVKPANWAATTAYALNAVVAPTTPNGFNYVCTVAGTSAATQPVWPVTLGATATDGTVTWACVAPADAYSRGWRADYRRRTGWQGRRLGLGPLGWIILMPVSAGYYVSTADDYSEVTLVNPPHVLKPPPGTK